MGFFRPICSSCCLDSASSTPLSDLHSLHHCHNFLCLPPLPLLPFLLFPHIPPPGHVQTWCVLAWPSQTPHHRRYVHSGLKGRWDCDCVCSKTEREAYGKITVVQLFVDQTAKSWEQLCLVKVGLIFPPYHWHCCLVSPSMSRPNTLNILQIWFWYSCSEEAAWITASSESKSSAEEKLKQNFVVRHRKIFDARRLVLTGCVTKLIWELNRTAHIYLNLPNFYLARLKNGIVLSIHSSLVLEIW